jgi:protein-S-isoprenylcysteine O-methyltransferase Ste14
MNPEELLIRRLMVCASGLIYWIGVWIQARRVRRQIGHWPNLKPRGPKEKALWFGWTVVILGWIGQPLVVGGASALPAMAFFPGMLRQASLVFGLTLLTLGYAGTLWAYIAMGNAWRIGINAKEKTALVNRGPYRWVRHPIYLFQVVMLTGAALLLPTVLSLVILGTHYLCARIKAWEEEKYLLALHGEAYRDQVSRTGGFFPRWIRRSPSAAKPQS